MAVQHGAHYLRVILFRCQRPEPSEQGLRGCEIGNFPESVESQFFGFHRQAPPLAIVKPVTLSVYFFEESNLLLKVFDHSLLIPIDPTCQAKENVAVRTHDNCS